MNPRVPPNVLSACLLALACGAATAQDEPAAHRYELTIDGRVSMEMQGQTQQVDALTTVRYTNEVRGNEVTLRFDSTAVDATSDGQKMVSRQLSRAGIREVQGETAQEFTPEEAPEEVRRLLEEGFEVPIARITTDADGKETQRRIVAKPGAKQLLDTGAVQNARLFHASFPRDEAKWQDQREVSMGNGGFADGKLTYEKLEPTDDGLVPVKVSGTLTKDRFQPPGNPLTVKDARYEVSGQQVYDPERSAWAGGELTLKVAFTMEVEGRKFGSSKGTMRVTLKSLDEEPAP